MFTFIQLELFSHGLKSIPWPAQSPDFNTIRPLLSFLETRVWNRFPPPTSLK
jgi:hypothetical protein